MATSTSTTNQGNSTGYTYSDEDIKKFQTQKIVGIGIGIFLGLITLYLLGAQVGYLVMTKRKGKSRRASNLRRRNSVSQINEHFDAIVIMCIFASLGALARVSIDPRNIYGHDNDFGCYFSAAYEFVAYLLCVTAIYSVLWLRQRIFYRDPRLQNLSSKFVRLLSWLMIIFLVSTAIGAIILFLISSTQEGSPIGCLTIPTDVDPKYRFLPIVLVVLYQALLLGLFIYPLIKHQQSINALNTSTERRNPMITLIKRATVTSVACILTDTASGLLLLVLKSGDPLGKLFYDVNLVINVICLIFSFPDWRKRLMPWRIKTEIRGETQISVIPDSSQSQTTAHIN